MAQFEGRKRFVFFPPADLSKVYRKRDVAADKSEAYVDVRHPDLEAFPEFESARAIECILEPGDVVYIPSKWPHYVECLTPSVLLATTGEAQARQS
jgi:lysine-specific demethylase 8